LLTHLEDPFLETAIMQSQSQQHAASADSGQAPQTQSGQFAQDSCAPFTAGYQQNGLANQPEGYHDGSAPLQGGLNFQNQRPGPKYSTLKGNMPFTMPPNMDLSGANRAPYNGQFVLFPSGPMLNGIPPISSFNPTSVLGPNQLSHLPYLPAMYPNASPNFPMGPATMQGYPFPFMADNSLQNLAGQKRNGWIASENQKVSGQSPSESPGNQCEFYPGPAVSTMDGSSIPLLNYNGLPQPCLPYQVMKTPNGYMLQDLESLTQQEPPIPRAVPAMWTNPSEVTLAKCLENREGITNVYIRGFLPQTTDEMLHAYAARFGKIDRCKAIVDLDTGLCKGYIKAVFNALACHANFAARFGFVQFYNFESCENCIRGFFYLGYQASFAQVL
jgi:NADPH-ferrihemoprotein reductase